MYFRYVHRFPVTMTPCYTVISERISFALVAWERYNN